MSLRDVLAEKYKSANKLLDELEIKMTKGEKFNSREFDNALNKIMGREPPHVKIPQILLLIRKDGTDDLRNEDIDKIMDMFNNKLNEDLQLITIEQLKFFCRYEIVYFKSKDPKCLNNITKLIEVMEKSKKY